MYGLEKSVSLDFLRDLRLEQVCIGNFQVILRFDKETSISIEGSLEISDGDSKVSRNLHADKPSETTELVALVGLMTANVANLGDGKVRLHFSNGALLTLFDSKKDFESYQISSAGIEEIIV